MILKIRIPEIKDSYIRDVIATIEKNHCSTSYSAEILEFIPEVTPRVQARDKLVSQFGHSDRQLELLRQYIENK